MLPISSQSIPTEIRAIEAQLKSGAFHTALKRLSDLFDQFPNDRQVVVKTLQIASRGWQFAIARKAAIALARITINPSKNWELITMSANIFYDPEFIREVKGLIAKSPLEPKSKAHFKKLIGTKETGIDNPQVLKDAKALKELFLQEKYDEVELKCRQALTRYPLNPPFVELLYYSLSRRNRTSIACKILANRIKYLPKSGIYDAMLAEGYLAANRYDDALTYADLAFKKGHNEFAVYNLKASALESLDRDEEAIEVLDIIQNKFERTDVSEMMKSKISEKRGELDAAEKHARAAYEANKSYLPAFLKTLKSKSVKPSDEIVQHAGDYLEDESNKLTTKIGVNFALGEIYHRAKDHDKAFSAYRQGNDLMRANYDFTDRNVYLDQTRLASLSAYRSENIPAVKPSDPKMIYITGMPRSGTTLVEQIISKHSTVTAGGEIDGSAAIFQPFWRAKQKNESDETIAGIIADAKAEINNVYADKVRGAEWLTNKAVNMHDHFIPILLANPGRKFITLRRDPRDNLFSIYRQRFTGISHTYAYHLETLAEHYNHYIATLNEMEKHFPDQFYQVHYENVVDDLEGEARKLLDYCELDWDPAVLEYYNSDNIVRTMSIQQVRQPIYKSSVAAWKPYEKHLEPLFAKLAEAGNLPE